LVVLLLVVEEEEEEEEEEEAGEWCPHRIVPRCEHSDRHDSIFVFECVQLGDVL
jgi:hypothetical protein